jgi:hypothetical protein
VAEAAGSPAQADDLPKRWIGSLPVKPYMQRLWHSAIL